MTQCAQLLARAHPPPPQILLLLQDSRSIKGPLNEALCLSPQEANSSVQWDVGIGLKTTCHLLANRCHVHVITFALPSESLRGHDPCYTALVTLQHPRPSQVDVS